MWKVLMFIYLFLYTATHFWGFEDVICDCGQLSLLKFRSGLAHHENGYIFSFKRNPKKKQPRRVFNLTSGSYDWNICINERLPCILSITLFGLRQWLINQVQCSYVITTKTTSNYIFVLCPFQRSSLIFSMFFRIPIQLSQMWKMLQEIHVSLSSQEIGLR